MGGRELEGSLFVLDFVSGSTSVLFQPPGELQSQEALPMVTVTWLGAHRHSLVSCHAVVNATGRLAGILIPCRQSPVSTTDTEPPTQIERPDHRVLRLQKKKTKLDKKRLCLLLRTSTVW